MRRKNRPEFKPHPDPVVELKLQHIRDMVKLRASCHGLIAKYTEEIGDAQEALADAQSRHSTSSFPISQGQLNNAERVTENRIRRAEEGIREQRAVLLGLGSQIQEAIGAAGLSEFDIAYLNLAALTGRNA